MFMQVEVTSSDALAESVTLADESAADKYLADTARILRYNGTHAEVTLTEHDHPMDGKPCTCHGYLYMRT